jgi:hypothetical protein
MDVLIYYICVNTYSHIRSTITPRILLLRARLALDRRLMRTDQREGRFTRDKTLAV